MNKEYVEIDGITIVSDEKGKICKIVPSYYNLDEILQAENEVEEIQGFLDDYEQKTPELIKRSKKHPLGWLVFCTSLGAVSIPLALLVGGKTEILSSIYS